MGHLRAFCALQYAKPWGSTFASAPAAVRAFFMPMRAASSTPSAARMAILRVFIPLLMVFAMLKAGQAFSSMEGRRFGWNCFTLPSAGTLMFRGLSTLAGTVDPKPRRDKPGEGSIDLSWQTDHPLSNGG